MSAVAPIGSTPEYTSGREEEPKRVSPAERTTDEVKTLAEVKSEAAGQAERTTLYDFRYTGKGSFIDKVF
ncbi:hypothetical protein [Desulfovibrio sp. Huiquan2017]|uniref:hypothetical protein n=1 Tax=Desulfovibrio sp. Huiquan2017 TaxID=2816861 RepID=UPI001A924A93|nr:hypothetical protein [Desulfovibrio sp. Huiquan2017]